jgi:hypothetical protein
MIIHIRDKYSLWDVLNEALTFRKVKESIEIVPFLYYCYAL